MGLFRTTQGWCAAAWSPQGLCALVIPEKNAQTALRQLNKKLPPLPPSVLDQPLLTVPASIQKEVQKALRGQKYHSVAIDLWFLTLFQQKVLKATCQIPWGEVRTYGWVAQKAGSPEGGRAAGQALNKSPISLLVPCHRVIASGHHLGGYGGDLTWKISLLKAEKVQLLRLSDGSYKVGWV